MSFPQFGRRLQIEEKEEEFPVFGRKLNISNKTAAQQSREQTIQERQKAYEEAQAQKVPQQLGKGAAYAVPEFVKGVGEILDIPAKLVPGGESELTPGQEALYKAEAEAPEKYLPFLQEEDILAPVRQPKGEDVLPAPTGLVEEAARRFSRVFGETGGTSPWFSALATGNAEIARSLGFEPETGELATFLGAGLKGMYNLFKESPQLLKSGLTKLRGVGKITPELPKQVVKEKDYAKATQLIQEEAQKIFNNIVSENVPISRLAKSNPNLDTQIKTIFDKVDSMATNNAFSTTEIATELGNVIRKIKGEAPVPTQAETEAIKILNRYRKAFGGKRTSQRPNLISEKSAVRQYRKLGEDTRDLHESSKRLSPSDKGKLMAYEIVKDALRGSIEANTPKEFSELFKASNQVYHKLMNFRALESVFDPIFNAENLNYKKLSQVMKQSKTHKILQKNLGKEGYEQFLELQSDLLDYDKLFKAFKVKDTKGIKEALVDIPTLALMTVFNVPTYLKLGLSGRKIPKVTKEFMKLTKSRAMLSPQTRSLSLRLKDALKSGNKTEAVKAGKELEKVLLEQS